MYVWANQAIVTYIPQEDVYTECHGIDCMFPWCLPFLQHERTEGSRSWSFSWSRCSHAGYTSLHTFLLIPKAVDKFWDYLLLLVFLALLKLELCTAAGAAEESFEEGFVQEWHLPSLYTFTSEGKVPLNRVYWLCEYLERHISESFLVCLFSSF